MSNIIDLTLSDNESCTKEVNESKNVDENFKKLTSSFIIDSIEDAVSNLVDRDQNSEAHMFGASYNCGRLSFEDAFPLEANRPHAPSTGLEGDIKNLAVAEKLNVREHETTKQRDHGEESETSSRSEKEKLEEKEFEKLRAYQYTMRGGGLVSEPYDKGEKRAYFKVLSYNVLSQKLLYENRWLYKHHNSKYLDWLYRRELLMKEFDEIQADILCLQEVQEDHKEVFFDKLKEKGYDVVYKKRTGGKEDGCAIYYNTTKFTLMQHISVEFHQPNVPILNRDNIGLLAKFHPVGFPKHAFVVGTTHLLFNPKRHDVKLAQMQVLLAEIERLAFKNKNAFFKYYPVILTGDFNLEPYTAVYQLLYAGQLYYEVLDRKKLLYAGKRPYPDQSFLPPAYGPPMGKQLLPPSLGITDFCQHQGVVDVRDTPFGWKFDVQDTLIGIYNSDRRNCPKEFTECENKKMLYETGVLYNQNFDFHSVYDHDEIENDTEATVKQDYWTTVDYLLYTPLVDPKFQHRQLQVVNRKRLPIQSECEKYLKNIPNRFCPSDHLPLVATFFLRMPSKPTTHPPSTISPKLTKFTKYKNLKRP